MADIVNIPQPVNGAEDTTPYFTDSNAPTAPPTPAMTQATAEDRSQTYNYALGETSPGKDAIFNDLMNGHEKWMRESLTSADQMRSFNQKQTAAQDFIDQKSAAGPLGQEDFDTAKQITQNILTPQQLDPSSFIERKYADQTVGEATAYKPDGDDDKPAVFQSAVDAMNSGADFGAYPDLVTPTDAANMDLTRNFVSKRMLVGKVAEDIMDQYKSTSYGSAAWDVAKSAVIPMYTWWHNKDAIEQTPDLLGDFSGNLKTQIDDIYSGKYSPEEARDMVKNGLDEMFKVNPTMANSLAQKLISYSDSDAMFDNVSGALDVAGAAWIGGDVLKMAMKTATRTTTIAGIKDLTGQVADAALRDTIDAAKKASTASSGAAKDSLDNLFGITPSLTNPQAVMRDAAQTRFSAGAVSNITDMLNNYGTGLIQSTLLDPLNVTRVPPGSEAYKAILQETQDTIARVYPRVNQSIMSLSPMRSIDNTITNNDIIRAVIGDSGANPFYNTYHVKQAAKRLGITDYQIVNHGDGAYGIAIDMPVDESLPTIQYALKKHVENVATPTTIQSQAINFFRASDKFVAKDINQEKKVAAGGAQKLSSLSKGILSKEIGSMKGASRQDLSDFLTHQQDNSYWSDSIGKFESDWQKFHNRLPTESEARSYYALRQINDTEYMVNNVRAYTLKSREALMQHKLPLKGFTAKDLPNVEAKNIKEIPWDLGDDAGILTWPNQAGQLFDYRRKVFTPARSAMRTSIDDLIKNQGYSVLQVSKYGQEALRKFAADNAIKDFPTGRLDYIVVKSPTAKPLDFQHIPYKAGGHYFYRDPFYIGQAKVVNSRWPGGEVSNDYLHDTAWVSARTQREATETSKHLENARILLESGQKAQAKAYVNMNLPMSYKQFVQAFNPKVGFLDLKTPIHWYPSDKSIEDTHKISAGYKNFSNVETSTHNVLNDGVLFRYGQEKGARLSGVYNVGSQEHPVWKMEPSRLIDPYNAVRRANGAIMNARFMDDLKIESASRYAQEFASVLKAPQDELNRFPLRSLMNANLIDKTHADQALVAKAQNYRRSVMEFLQSETRSTQLQNKLNEMALSRIVGLDRQELAMNWMEKLTTSDPKAFLRYWAGFIPNMGLWNPKQLWMQGQGMTVTASMEGWARATKAGGAGWYMRGAIMNGDRNVQLEAARSAATHFGWKPKHFMESMEGMQKTDFWRVGDNWADINDIRNANSTSSARSFADSSLYFFNKGERANKITAWNASYLKWRDANPVMPFKGAAVKQVLEYADFLTMSMSRASAAGNQANAAGFKGWASVATQFWSYQTRMMDAMFGKELSTSQKMKFLGYQSLLYGVPIGVLGNTAGAFLQPSQAIRKFAEYEGWDLTNPLVQAAVNGIPQTLLNLATGADQNIAQTLGPSGNSVIPDILGSSKLVPDWVKAVAGSQGREGKSDLLTILGGAAGTKVKQTIDASSPLVGYLLNSINPNWGKPYTVYDFADLMQLTTPTNNAMKAWFAYNTGKYMNRQGQSILPDDQKLGAGDAAMQLVFGTIPQQASDYYGQIENNKARENAQETARQKAIEAYKRSMADGLSDDDIRREIDTAQKWMVMGDLTAEQRASVLRDAYVPHMSKLEQLENKINTGTHSNYMKWLGATTEGNQPDESNQ